LLACQRHDIETLIDFRKTRTVMIEDRAKATDDLLLFLLAVDDHRPAFLRHGAEPVATKDVSGAELQHEQTLADAAFAGEQRDVAPQEAAVDRPVSWRDRLGIPLNKIDGSQLWFAALRFGSGPR